MQAAIESNAINARLEANRAYGRLLGSVDEALHELQTPVISDGAIHNARKALKKARAALRLLRDGVDKVTYQTENAALRDAGRCLSPLRDARSLIAAFESLREHHPDEVPWSEVGPLHTALRAKRAAARRRLVRSSNGIRHGIRLLDTCRDRMTRPQFSAVESIASTAIISRIRDMYRSGRKARNVAKLIGTPEVLHEWRKAVKYLRNAVEGVYGSNPDLPASAAAREVATISRRADEIAQLLGDDHDLAVLSQDLDSDDGKGLTVSVSESVRALIEKQRATLEKRAIDLGATLYDQKPKRFASVFKRLSLEHSG